MRLGKVHQIERRRETRFPYTGRVKVAGGPEGNALEGELVNLSLSGCMVSMDLTEGLELETLVDVCLEANVLRFRGLGLVESLSEDGMVGISFVLVSPRGEKDLQWLMKLMTCATLGTERHPEQSLDVGQ